MVTPLGADGIAVSTNVRTWAKGAGSYGEGWGETGTGITVLKGETFYVKYYSESRDAWSLHYANHDRVWVDWNVTGPALSGDVGGSRRNPVILRIRHAGTSQSTVTWTNAPDKCAAWKAFTMPGKYDLALGQNSKWTLPPITILDGSPFWAGLFGWLNHDRPPDAPGSFPVPDRGPTAVLLAIALLSFVAFAMRKLR